MELQSHPWLSTANDESRRYVARYDERNDQILRRRVRISRDILNDNDDDNDDENKNHNAIILVRFFEEKVLL